VGVVHTHPLMCSVPHELAHLIRDTLRVPLSYPHTALSRDTPPAQERIQGPAQELTQAAAPEPIPAPAPQPLKRCLSVHLAAIEARKALEVEHYLRACAMRLDAARAPWSV
jgi:hypothetical protein